MWWEDKRSDLKHLFKMLGSRKSVLEDGGQEVYLNKDGPLYIWRQKGVD